MSTVLPLVNGGQGNGANNSENQGAGVEYGEQQQPKNEKSGARVRRAHPPVNDKTPFTSPGMSGHPSKSHHLLVGLTVAGVASTLLTTVFSLFHVDVFLSAYELPLASYSRGSFIFSVINTLNDVVGAWVVDQSSAASIDRSDMVGLAGCVFCLCFLTPFFRWRHQQPIQAQNHLISPAWKDTCHFVMTMSLYDTLYSFTSILMGSIVVDDHTMTDNNRVQFMASGKVVNLFASFIVARIGLAVFDVNDLFDFRVFVVVVATVATGLFVASQFLMNGIPTFFRDLRWPRDNSRKHTRGSFQTGSPARPSASSGTFSPRRRRDQDHDTHQLRKLQWRTVISDFWKHSNFHKWIVMEMLLEAQVTFSAFFLKTFVDGLIHVDGGLSRESCDWFMATVRPMKQIATIFAYIPIRHYGYPKMYTALFVANFAVAGLMFLYSNSQSPVTILVFLTFYCVATGAVKSSGKTSLLC